MADIIRIIETHPYLPYLILLVWTFLEGETIVIVAGIAARDGQPYLPLVILFSFGGSLCSDQVMFFLGRYKGKRFIAKRPRWQAKAEKVYRLLEEHQTGLILGFRFLYGLRNITPLAIGMSEVSVRRFVVLNVLGALVWACSFTYAGYFFGAALEKFFAEEHKTLAIATLLAAAAAAWIVRIVRRRRKQTNASCHGRQ